MSGFASFLPELKILRFLDIPHQTSYIAANGVAKSDVGAQRRLADSDKRQFLGSKFVCDRHRP
jgi:hypothetical protein